MKVDISSSTATEVVLDGRYRLGGLIGQGGTAAVYRGRDDVLGRDVAIKLFRTAPDSDDEAEQISDEVRFLAGLSHPNLVTVFDAGIDTVTLDRRAYLIMELLESPDLHRARSLAGSDAQYRLSEAEVTTIGVGIATALAHIHHRGIVHRDVKPANIRTGETGNRHRSAHPKLTDVGVAGFAERRQPDETGLFTGTAVYFSPEQVSGGALTAATDVYSLALVLLECLTGEVAFPGEAVPSAAARLHRRPHIPARLGHEWVELLTNMTDRAPAARPRAAEVAATLCTVAGLQTDIADRATETSAPTEKVRTVARPGSEDASTRLPSANPRPHTSPMTTVEGANASRPHVRWTGSRLHLPEEDETHRNRAEPIPGKRRVPRLARWAMVALIVAIAILTVATALALLPDTGGAPVDYPAVPAELGNRLEELQESVGRP